jgi:hypothetical protein
METEHDYEHEAQAGGEMKEAGGTRFWWRWRERERERERRERGKTIEKRLKNNI